MWKNPRASEPDEEDPWENTRIFVQKIKQRGKTQETLHWKRRLLREASLQANHPLDPYHTHEIAYFNYGESVSPRLKIYIADFLWETDVNHVH